MLKITEKKLKQIILKHYGYLNTQDSLKRKLYKCVQNSNYGQPAFILYSIEGSPPKGVALYFVDFNSIMLFSARSEERPKTKYIQNIKICDDKK